MALGDLVRSVGVFQTFDPFFNHISLAMCSFAPCHRCKMYEEVITGPMLELVMTLTDHIDCIVDKIKIILDINLMEWNSEILKKKN